MSDNNLTESAHVVGCSALLDRCFIQLQGESGASLTLAVSLPPEFYSDILGSVSIDEGAAFYRASLNQLMERLCCKISECLPQEIDRLMVDSCKYMEKRLGLTTQAHRLAVSGENKMK